MDYKLRRKTILLTILAGITVILVILFANAGKLQKDNKPTTVSASQGETVVLVDGENTATSISYQKIGDDSSHWKQDETFFDEDNESLAKHLMDEMLTLSVSAVSVEKDIRVRVTDYQSNLKAGVAFEAVIKNNKTGIETVVTDEDLDGILYCDNLEQGSYLVYLRPVEGYTVPDDGLNVVVTENVEYTVIEDIFLLMTEETEASAAREDTMVLTAEADADKSMLKSFGNDPNGVYGVDISSKNGEVDWNQVYKAGIRFVMLRAAYRGSESGEIYIDSSFYENAKKAKYAGLDVGAFIYSQAMTEKEAVEEASALIELTRDLRLPLPLTIRLDMAGGKGRADELSEEKRTTVVNAFCQTVKNFGKEACIYATYNWLNTNIDYNVLDKNMLWLAEYREIPKYDGYFDIWQYSCKGKVSGIEGNVNLNISYIK